MDYSLLTYDFTDRFNIGDYIQSLSARQFLPRVDHYICREALHTYSGPPTKIILNGWFMRHTRRWPPASSIDPLFISFHLNPKKAEGFLMDGGAEYLKAHEPIGCRDFTTLRILEKAGIRAYFSACLTLTLGQKYRHQADEAIYLVDILNRLPTKQNVFKSINSFIKSIQRKEIFLLGKREKFIRSILRGILGDALYETAQEIPHVYPAVDFPMEKDRIELADKTLARYERARLVITSRIHCALPCLAMGTPVIFINGGFQAGPASRFDGLIELFHTVNISLNGEIDANFNLEAFRKTGTLEPKTLHLKYVQALSEKCRQFINKPVSISGDQSSPGDVHT